MPYKHPVSIVQAWRLLNGIRRAGWLKNGLINSISASTHTMKGIFLLLLLAHLPVSISVGMHTHSSIYCQTTSQTPG